MQHLDWQDKTSTIKWVTLYHEINNLLRQLGENGCITPQDKIIGAIVNALNAIDDGVHNKTIQKGSENEHS
jgi:hypothetical protein